jgi:hypothetical protein
VTPPGRISIAAASRFILAQPAPVLFPDTCALLDVVRAPARQSGYLIPIATEFTALATATPRLLHIVICDTVTVEWYDHFDEALREVAAYVQQGRDLIASLREACAVTGLPYRPRLAGALRDLPVRLGEIASHLFAAALVVEDDQECVSRAYRRQVLNLPPSRQGRGMKDCAILEHALGLGSQLEAAGFSQPRAFCSSNTNDFCETGRNLHSALRPEFLAAGLEYVPDLRVAKYRLGF